ncbi:MAG: hypothetical protein QNJ87_03305 [Gammaproteobacteria bacterium]|nr:hypothetical protein [Gammaproteobacteria bacterium]MDJ0870776.1 hypothetical protein [Gammaproteobacteria bacterium]
MDVALEIAKLYFIPSGLFLTALGTARTEPLKTAVSALGFLMAAFWAHSIADIPPHAGNLASALRSAPYFFLLLWGFSTLAHSWRWFEKWKPATRIQRLEARVKELKEKASVN